MDTKVIAIFDFDGTITRGDSLFPFLKYAVGRRYFYFGIMKLSFVFLKFLLRIITNHEAKQKVLAYYLSGKTPEELEQVGVKFAEKINQMVKPEALRRIQWHQDADHITVLASASLEIYLKPWAIANSFDYIYTTHLAVDADGKITGYFEGENCYGVEKLRRVLALIKKRSDYLVYMYGDSKGDRELLEYADVSYYKTFENPIKTLYEPKQDVLI
ncbi:MAG: HAD-IB family hydrolase [Syntrophomonas sp.]|nr:HAD-IB family hydrolase [Syntrophomonas sp.]